MDRVNEKTTHYVTATFLDKSQVASAPTSARYRVDAGDGTEILDWTNLTPAESVEITLGKAINTLLDANAPEEIRIVTVEAVYGPDDSIYADFAYRIINLKHVT